MLVPLFLNQLEFASRNDELQQLADSLLGGRIIGRS
jgi:hypothetical protein